MLLLILFGVLILIGIAMVLSYNLIVKSAEHLQYKTFGIGISGVVLIVLNVILLFFFSIPVFCTQISKDKNYQDALYEKEVLEYRLENKDENLVGNEMLYSEITKFNNELREHKTYCNNLWLNLFHNDKIATIDYIELKLRE